MTRQIPAELSESEEAPLFGMIYDAYNEPCPDASIIIDQQEAAVTDINGRFTISSLARGEHIIRIVKEGYEPIDVRFLFLNRNQVFHAQVFSFRYILDKAEESLETENWAQCRWFLQRAEAIFPEDPELVYLQGLYFFNTERYDQALTVLQPLTQRERSSAFVHLLLSDIYQYGLEDTQSAAEHLEAFLQLRGSREIEERLASLTNAQPSE
ncbi:MAG: hypothetical protein ACLFR1_11180 [Spirochaetia bacterium]